MLLFLLHQLPQSLRNRSFVGRIFFRLGLESIPIGGLPLLLHLVLIMVDVAATFQDTVTLLCRPCDHPTHVSPGPYSMPTKPLTSTCTDRLPRPLLSLRAHLTADLVLGELAATTEPATFGEEALAGVATEGQRLVFIAQLVPEGVKLGIVRSDDDVRELVEHSVDDFFEWEKEGVVAGISEAQENLLPVVVVQPCVLVSNGDRGINAYGLK